MIATLSFSNGRGAFATEGGPFDRPAFLNQVGGDPELAAELINIFLEDCPTCLTKLRAAGAASDPQLLRETAHYLAEALSQFSATTAMDLARELERAGQRGVLDDLDSILPQLEQETDRLRAALLEFLSTSTAGSIASPIIQQVAEPPPAPTAVREPEEPEPLTALVVDDSDLDRRLACGIIERCRGWAVLEAKNGKEALKVLAKHQPTLLVTDMQMPQMDGLELVESVRDRFPEIPVVLMTAVGSEEIAAAALQRGAASYVPKRLLTQELPETLVRVSNAAQADRRTNHLYACLSDLDCRFVLPNDPALVKPLVMHYQQHISRLGLCKGTERVRLGVAVEEALLNGIHHGNLELDSKLRQGNNNAYAELGEQRRRLQPYCDRRVHVQLKIDSEQAVLIIRDEGPGFDPKIIPDPNDPENLTKPSGRGLLLIRTFMDSVFHNATGNQITMIKRRRAAA